MIGPSCADDDQEGLAVQRDEGLRAERVSFQAVQFIGRLPGLGAEDAQRQPAFGIRFELGEVGKALAAAFVDRIAGMAGYAMIWPKGAKASAVSGWAGSRRSSLPFMPA